MNKNDKKELHKVCHVDLSNQSSHEKKAKIQNVSYDDEINANWIHIVLLCIPAFFYFSMIINEPKKKDIYDANIRLITKDLRPPNDITGKPFLTAYTTYDYFDVSSELKKSIFSNAEKQKWKKVPKEFFEYDSIVTAYCDRGTMITISVYSDVNSENVSIGGTWRAPFLGILGSGDYCYENS